MSPSPANGQTPAHSTKVSRIRRDITLIRRVITIVIAIGAGLAGAYASWTINSASDPVAAGILASITGLSAFKLIIDVSRTM